MPTSGSPTSPRVSIGLPVYNGEEYIREALRSILDQTFTDFELIICDNASTDETESICRAFSERDSRIRYYENDSNLGAAKNYNRTLKLAQGEYFRWACHDDKLAPRCLEACVDVLDERPEVALAYPQTQLIDAGGEEMEDQGFLRHLHLVDMPPSERFAQFFDAYVWGGFGGQLFGLMRTETLRSTMQHGDFPSADLIFIGEMTLWGEMYEISEKLNVRRIHEGNSVFANDQEIDKIWEWFDSEQGEELKWLEWRWLKELIAAIQRAPLTPEERRRCYRILWSEFVTVHGHKYVKEILYMLSAKLGIARREGQKISGLNTMYDLV